MIPSNHVLSVAGLRKTYGDTVAVDEVSFTVERNEIVGLLGPNGAGKTTTINMILSVLEPTSGSHPDRGPRPCESTGAKRSRGPTSAAVYAPLPGNLTVTQNLRIFGMIYDVKTTYRIASKRCLRLSSFRAFRDTKCGVLSSLHRGADSASAWPRPAINQPTLLLLDEPTASLDPRPPSDIRIQIKPV